jgi:tryptophan synthase beta subunit
MGVYDFNFVIRVAFSKWTEGMYCIFPHIDITVDAFKLLSVLEGIIPALETSHAIAYLGTLCKSITDQKIVVNLSGRGDKDINTIV